MSRYSAHAMVLFMFALDHWDLDLAFAAYLLEQHQDHEAADCPSSALVGSPGRLGTRTIKVA